MIKRQRGRRGQALLLITLSIFALCGLLGLAIDLGYSYWVKKAAQNAADSAALAAAYQAFATVGPGNLVYPASFAHSLDNCGNLGSVANLSNGCLYAANQSSGFTHDGHNGHQDVTMESGVNGSPADCNLPAPTAPCINAYYWVTVRTVETMPQLFSVLLGNTVGMSSARATAAIIPVKADFSLLALNRKNDTPPKLAPPVAQGTDVQMKGGEVITAPKGLIISSNSSNAFSIDNNAQINAPITAMSGLPNPGASGNNTFQNQADGQPFYDPYEGKGQPPLVSGALNTYAVMQGNLGGTIYQVNQQGFVTGALCGGLGAPACGNVSLPSGNYFPATSLRPANPLGAGVSPLAGGLSIGGGGTTTFADGNFGNFFFYGGLSVSGAMQMGAGEYVLVGGGGGDTLAVNNGANITNNGSVGPGAIFIATGTSSDFTFNSKSNPTAITGNTNNDLYVGLMTQINSSQALVNLAGLKGSGSSPALGFGDMQIKTGFGQQDTADPSGIDPSNSSLPSALGPFAGVIFWQDQANSTIDYTTPADTPSSLPGYGYVDRYNCPGATIDNPCTKTLQDPSSPELNLAPGNAALGFKGIIYQPRGAWINIGGAGAQGGQGITGAIQIITGFVAFNGGGVITLTPPPIPLTKPIVALIE